ncbi:MAG: MFS transporter [Bacteroidota bacterium]
MKKTSPPYLIIALLILSGEAIFLLPFVLPRVFRPTFLEVFQINNFELGAAFSIYGIVAMASYFFGGIIADRFRPRKLMAVALIMTALGGFALSSYPSLSVLNLVYGYWGCTTILLFWAAMIKATREWGGDQKQGKAFGFLDGGRGLVGALMGVVGVYIFSLFMTEDVENVTGDERREAFRQVILFTSFLIIVVALMVWRWLKTGTEESSATNNADNKLSIDSVMTVVKIPTVWLLMVIILCGYVGYKITDVFSLYAKEVMLYNEVDAAKVGTLLLFVRPVTGITFGVIADRTRSSLWVTIGFVIMFFGALLFASGILGPGLYALFFISLIATCIGVYSIRALYFAVLHEGHIPLALTGTAVGLVSLVGYTPDIFVGPITGYLLDSSPGEPGHQHVFIMLAIFSAVGFIASVAFQRYAKKKAKEATEVA